MRNFGPLLIVVAFSLVIIAIAMVISSSAHAAQVVEVTDTVDCQGLSHEECAKYLPPPPTLVLQAPAIVQASADTDAGDILLFGGGQLPSGGLSGGFGGVELGGAWCPGGTRYCLRASASVALGSVGNARYEVDGAAGLLIRDLGPLSIMVSFYGHLGNDDTFAYVEAGFGGNVGARFRVFEGFPLGIHVKVGPSFDKAGDTSLSVRFVGGAGWSF